MFFIRRTSVTLAILFFIVFSSIAQTRWKGTASTAWSNAANWTAGVPNASVDAIIGDASFTGSFQPSTSTGAACKNLIIGGGTKLTTLSMSRSLTVSGGVTINTNGAISQGRCTIKLTGNWINNGGGYSTTSTSASVVFGGTAQTIGGTTLTTFRRLTINPGSITTLTRNTAVIGRFSVSGTFNPGEATTYQVTGAATLTVNNGGILKVHATTYAGNYATTGATTLNSGSIVDYAAAVNQAVSTLSYTTLRISGSGTKTLDGPLTLKSTLTTDGNIYVLAGTLDLSTFTATRNTSTTGGTLSVANGAILKIGGTNGFPANFATNTLNLTSTVEYTGAAQTVAAQTYGNLILSSSSGAVTKTMPSTAFTVAGNLTSAMGAGTSVSYTAASTITVSGNVNIGAGTTFNGGSFIHNIAGNWVNAGTFTGNTSTVRFNATGAIINGAGAQNFFNLESAGSNVSAATGTNLTVAGNLSTTGSGTFTHTPTGTLTMSGAGKTISGTGIQLANLSVSGSVTTASSFGISGNLAVVGTGNLTASNGTVTMSGTANTISNSSTLSLSSLSISGSVTTTSNFTITSLLAVSGSLMATNGTTTFSGTTVLSGTANLYNVTLTGTSLQLAANAVLGIANTYTPGVATLNVTAAVPNTVNFNGSGIQTVNAGTYHHLMVSNGSTKTAGGAITTNGDLTIGGGTTYNGGSATHTINRNWVNNGTFTSSSSTVQFVGNADAQLTGATTFNVLTVNKTSVSNGLTLLNNVSSPTVNMTNGWMKTGTNTLTITSNRTGNGIILGTIQRTHSFTTGTAYAFESPNNSIAFSAVSGVTSIIVSIAPGSISDFPFGASVNRVYTITIPAGAYTAALRLHYEDEELNGNIESAMALWRFNSIWNVSSPGTTTNNTADNYVEQSGLTNITNRWTVSSNANVVAWNGSISSDWNTAANWTTIQGSPNRPPSANDIVQLGTAIFPIANQPTISNAVTVKNIVFGSAQATTLTLGTGGSLSTNGSITGTWTANTTHAINVGAQALTIGGDLALSDGVPGRAINLSIGSGAATIKGSLLQSGNAKVEFTGAGTLAIGNNYTYSNGIFTAGTGTVIYNGSAAQSVAGVGYNHLIINKTAGVASIDAATTVGGNLTLAAGQLAINATTTVSNNVTINAGGTLNAGASTINVGGNWTNSGTFIPSTSLVTLNGAGAQAVSATSFNHLTVNKSAGVATLAGSTPINGNLTVTAGTLNLSTFSANRASLGGSFTLANDATLLVGGSNNFPANFASYSLGNTSTVHYNGTSTQVVGGVSYGHLVFSNGGANAKTLTASATINGDITINSGASFDASVSNINMHGNWTNNGSFIPGSSTLLLYGASKTITGNTTFNRLNVYGSYTVAGSDITFNGRLFITPTGSYAAGSGTATVLGDLTNSGILTSNGTTTFTGGIVQNIRLLNAIESNSSGIINFNGSVSPVLNSTSEPKFYNLNINNKAGVNPSVNWTVYGNFTVGAEASFNGGASTHTFSGNVTNNGTINSSGTLHFNPSAPATAKLAGTNFTSTGIVIFGGTAPLTVTGTPTKLTDVIIANTNAVTPSAGWDMLGSFTINGGAVFNAGSHSYFVRGDIESTGTLNGGTSTFTITSAEGQVSGSAGTTFHHFTVASTGIVTTNSEINVAGNFTNDGDFDAANGALIMTGSVPATIGGITSPSPIAQLVIAKTTGSTVTLARDVSEVADLYIASGTLDAGALTITQDATTGGLLTIDDGATLKIGGINTLPTFSTLPGGTPAYALSKYSTVDYAGSTQAISAVTSYGNLTISTSGVKTPAAALAIQNNFTLANGTFTGGNYTHLLGGNWVMSSGAFTNAGTTISLNGTDVQDIYTTGAFNNLTINKASGLTTLSNPATVNGVLALTSGKIDIGNNNLTIGSSGSITGASSSNYIIAERAGSLKQQVISSVAKAFPIGLTNSYLPATITPAAGFVTDNFSARLLTAAYTGGTSGTAVTSNAVNATWIINEDVSGSSNATITLQWPGGLELSGFNRSLSRLARYTGATWDYGTSDISASGINPYNVSRAGITTFGAFAISSFNALPVSWLRVSGKNENRDNHISWATASETNNSYFVVEASTDGRVFTVVGRVKGATNSAAVQEYSFIHKQVATSETFYRIKQVDNDGKYSYSKVIKVVSGNTQEYTIRLLSNPVRDQAVVLLNLHRSQQTTFVVNDASGKIVYRKVLYLRAGVNTVYVDASQWQGGMYFMSVSNEDGEKNILPFLKK